MGNPEIIRPGGYNYNEFSNEYDRKSYKEAMMAAGNDQRRINLLEDAKDAYAPFSIGDKRMYHSTGRVRTTKGEIIGVIYRRHFGKTIEKLLSLLRFAK